MKYSKIFLMMMLVFIIAIMTACGNSNEESADVSDDSTEENSNDESTGEESSVDAAGGDTEGRVTVSAAASLTDALNDIAEMFNEEYPEVEVDYNFGGSGALQQQISQGAPADLFFSASESDFQTVVDEGFIVEENAENLLANELVLIVPEGTDTVTSFDDLENAGQIAVGTPDSVPAGEYSVEAYESMGLYDELESKFVYAEDVRAVLNYVETGNVDAGTVYRTDAETSDNVEIVDAAEPETHDPIIYPVGLLNETESPEAAEAFYNYIQSEDALAVFEDYGFVIQ